MTKKLMLRPNVVGDYDGAYDWVKSEDEEKHPEYFTVGHHSPTGWPEDDYIIVIVDGGE
jgi:hypothetical protein